MCACRLEVGSPSSESKIDLDNYYLLAETMGERQEGVDSPGTPGEDDVYSQLAQKERDLTLAAELGKALLDRTEELERRNEQTIEEFAQKLEAMEQEKYELHLKLEKKETEYENTIKELQFDIGQLRNDLHSQQNQSTSDVKERSQTIRELTLQNERLNEEVRLASSREDELQSQVQSLREKMRSRRTSMHGHVTQLEILQEEINFLTQRKHEVESRILAITEEKDALACSLEESQERILMLEKSKREAEQRLQNQERDIMELQETNLQLQAQLHHMSTNNPRPNHHSNNQSQSLFSEISQMSPHLSPDSTHEMSNQFPLEPGESLGHQMSLAEMMEEDDYECDDEDLLPGAMATPLNSTMLTESQFLTHFENSPIVMETDDELRQELIHVYTQLRHMCSSIRYRQTDVPGTSSEATNVPPGGLSNTLQELRELMEDMMTFRPTISIESQVALEEEDILSVSELQNHITDLKIELQGAQCDLDRVKNELTQRDSQLEEKAKELGHLTNKVSILELTMQHDELSKLQTQRDAFQSTLADQGEVTRDVIIEQARKDRDIAIEKQNKMEIELAKAKLDLLTLNGQLMEAIQQKVALSQELDQWQVDMEELLELQMRKRIKQESDKEEVCEELKKHLQGMRKSKSSSSFMSICKQSKES